MSIRRGNKIIASRISNGFSLFDCKWADHVLNNISWLRADTFSWQSGDVYKAAYEHLLEDFENRVGKGTDSDGWLSETIDGVTVYYIVAPDGHKICVSDNESNVEELYENTGIAWYYILDKANKRFKLPRTKWGFTGLRNGVGESIEAGLPNITGYFMAYTYGAGGGSGAVASKINNPNAISAGTTSSYNFNEYTINASRSSSVYGNSDTVQPPATEMYLYFYVGNYVEDITTIDAGKLAEAVNDFDIDTFKSEVDEVRNEAISDINQTTSDSVTQLKNMGEVVNYTNITNCITEIPQDIKLELSDGVFTLKTGSKAYLPNGSGVFDVITILSDKTLTNVTNGTYVVCVTGGGGLIQRDIAKCVSGETRPLTTTYMLWYDRTNNVINNYGSDSTTPAHTASLPIAIITVTDGAISSIDQVFNGFGYIGSTVFTLPGVKGVYPNGRNEDGTLKNGIINCTTVQLSSNFNDSRDASLLIDSKGQCKWYSTTGWYYDEVDNIMYVTHDNAVLHHANLGTFTVLMGTISNFNNNTVFRAADYNDLVKKQDAATSVNYGNITNCITHIPQDIKLEIVDGVLTLKAGSNVYIPNGPNSFKKKTATTDVITHTGTYTGKFMIFDNGSLTSNSLRLCRTPYQFSGTTAPSSPQVDTTWYDTTNNIVKVYQSSQWTGQRTLPLAIATFDAGVCVSIDQVFNGFGYIGSTAFALPGVKALIPDGRNEDGTLKNRNMTVQSVLTKTIPSNTGWHYMTFNSIGTEIDVATNYYTGTELPSGATSYSRFYNTAENNIYTVVSGKLTKFPQFILDCYIDHSTSSPYKINSMKQATAFNVVDYNDTGFIAHQAMPSDRYVDLTLGGSGASYTASADGWFFLHKAGDNPGQFLTVINRGQINFDKFQHIGYDVTGGMQLTCLMPARKGDVVHIGYSLGGQTYTFRFIYANGSK